jgi:hypothetical protein
MAGGHERHLDQFGMCQCKNRNGIETMEFEVQDERTGRYRMKRVPACADCFGLI